MEKVKAKSLRWCFTINNYHNGEISTTGTSVMLEHVRSVLSNDKVRYAIFGKEVGEQGTPHLQGYISFKSQQRFSALKKAFPTAHLEVAQGNEQQNYEYCSKQGDYEEFGKRSESGRRNDIHEATTMIKEGKSLKAVAEECSEVFVKYGRGLRDLKLILDSPYSHETVRGVWIWGPPGSGKSHAARDYDPDCFLKPQNKWFDGYNGQKTILLDDLDTPTLGHYLKIWSDKYACTGETKGGTINLRHTKFIVTSNYTPDELWPDDKLMCQAIKRRFIMNHKQYVDNKVNFN